MINRTDSSDNIYIKTWDCKLCRIILIAFTSFLVLLFLISVFANPVINLIIYSQLISLNNEQVNLKIEGHDVFFFQNRLDFFNSTIVITDSTEAENDSTFLFIPYLSVKGTNWLNQIFGSGYSFGEIIIHEPLIRISSSNKTSSADTSESSIKEDLKNIFPDNIYPFSTGRLYINSANIIRMEYDEELIIDSIENLSVFISDLNLEKKNKKSLISSYRLSMKNFHRKITDTGYDLKISSVTTSSSNALFQIEGLTLIPFISDEEFFEGDVYRRDRWKVNIPGITAYQTDIETFLNSKILRVDSLVIPNFKIEIFTNRRLPIDPQIKPEMPHEIMSSLNFGIEIEKFHTEYSIIILESVMPEVKKRARLEFSKVNALISNISNTKRKQTKENPCIIKASGYLQNEGKLNLHMTYPLLSENLNFSYEGSLSEMNARLFNSHIEVEDKARIESGKIVRVNFSSDVKNGIASVNIIPLYNNLKIKILDEESIKEKKIESFISNIKIRESNPDDNGEIKSGNIMFKRKRDTVFLDVIWLALLEGLSEAVGF